MGINTEAATAPMTVIEIKSKDQYDETIAKDGLVVVDFTATWCGPCQRIKPEFHQMADENPNVKFLSVDVDQKDDIAQMEGIQAMPTFKFYKDGSIAAEFQGADPQKLRAKVQELSN